MNREELRMRPSTNRIAPAFKRQRRNFIGPQRFKRAPQAITEFSTYENDTFSVSLPTHWDLLSDEGAHFFGGARDPFAVQVKIFDKTVCDASTSFFTCGLKLSRAENLPETSIRSRINHTSQIVRQSQFRDTILNTQVQTETYTESFSGQFFNDSNEYFVSRYFVANLDGKVYMLETRVPLREAHKYIKATKTIFDSFRIYPPFAN
jgi:hypothetical protein